MKRAAGFTLIELVIVIVILGILGAVAAPRFINLQDDAYAANINGLKSSIQSAMTLANTKAVLEGEDKGTGKSVTDYSGVIFDHGYPIAATDGSGILGTLQDVPDSDYSKTLNTDGDVLAIQPDARKQGTTYAEVTKCFVKYTEATSSASPTVTVNDDCE